MRDDEAGGGPRPDELGEIAPVHAAEARVEPAPARDAVDVGRDLGLRQLPELLPREPDRVLDLTEDAEIPHREIDLRH